MSIGLTARGKRVDLEKFVKTSHRVKRDMMRNIVSDDNKFINQQLKPEAR